MTRWDHTEVPFLPKEEIDLTPGELAEVIRLQKCDAEIEYQLQVGRIQHQRRLELARLIKRYNEDES